MNLSGQQYNSQIDKVTKAIKIAHFKNVQETWKNLARTIESVEEKKVFRNAYRESDPFSRLCKQT